MTGEEANISNLNFILSISGSLIIILLTIIGYLLKQFYVSVKDLKRAVDQLSIVLSVEQERGKHITESVISIKELAEGRLNNLTNRVDIMEKDVAVLKAKDSLYHNGNNE